MVEQHPENYTEGRWKNWIARAKESGFSLSDPDNAPDTTIFVNMEDDVVLACLKVINRFRKKKISNSKAREDIKNIERITLAKVEPINDDIDMMIQSIQSSLVGVFGSCQCYIGDRYGSGSIDEVIVQAIEAEKGGDPEAALELVSQAGAKILAGQSFKFNRELPPGCVAEWVDGLDSISATMVGGDGYKEDVD
ncbi:MAG: DUF2150 family protein [Methanosarcinales archaeon Met12]|nr:MAG: DUF2150 family protein [Methanosarcinales archaeon Met12]